ncbi:uncharacterized protein K452DRAFT_284124 [Aplosporella prunicola CBS 121167]|uniref:Uncharacterized protein n=1 Tax=Aplosporella prunicola CBS 121167 TaxID=1176127 RepID=A0A6A6BNP9_9PEZI|nr:uncharacterized protein K452DRAFT_284124 [Aplosporella prunicola CBS 121167]KAF2145750.1 hypothetical protein K452DRAFT_284124 [Aplosporella prunicola CBS 121167]
MQGGQRHPSIHNITDPFGVLTDSSTPSGPTNQPTLAQPQAKKETPLHRSHRPRAPLASARTHAPAQPFVRPPTRTPATPLGTAHRTAQASTAGTAGTAAGGARCLVPSRAGAVVSAHRPGLRRRGAANLQPG